MNRHSPIEVRWLSALVVGTVTVAVPVLAPAAVGKATSIVPRTPASARAKPCVVGSVSALIGGKRICLRAGQRCNKSFDRQYHAHRFHCHTGRLARASRPKPSAPPAPSRPGLPSAGMVVARIPVGVGVLAAGEGAVWLRAFRGDSVRRIDPTTNAVVATIKVGQTLDTGLAVGDGSVWTTNGLDGTVSRIDPGTNSVTATIPVRGSLPNDLVTTPGTVWTSNHAGDPTSSVSRLTTASNSLAAKILVGAPNEQCCGADALAYGAGSIWVLVPNRAAVLRIDPQTNSVTATIPFDPPEAGCNGEMAGGDEAVWVSTYCDGNVRRIDPRTNAFVAKVDVAAGGVAGAIALGYGSVWATSGKNEAGAGQVHLVRIDPRTNKPFEELKGLGGTFQETHLAIGFGSVWLTDAISHSLLRIAPQASSASAPQGAPATKEEDR